MMSAKNNYYGSLSQEPSSREQKNAQLAREAAREGFVLLKNEGVLPLVSKKIALYGTGARKTISGGTGSGAVQPRYTVSIEEGLEKAGYEVTTKEYLNDYDTEFIGDYEKWRTEVEDKIAHLADPMQALMEALSYAYQYPGGRLITDEDIVNSHTDTAIYVVMRQAGEGNDRRLESGDFYLTDIELKNIKKIATDYKHTILVINVGGIIDLSTLDDIEGINGLIFYVQGGMEGGNAFADVVSGKHSFSGKLASTWPMHYEDIPFGEKYSYLNGDLENEYYQEGIYVGYRYFDSFDVSPRFPFGYGLTYADFSIVTTDVKVAGKIVELSVEVTNTDEKYTGKEVVQVYLSSPIGKLHKEYQQLVSFAKTSELKPGEKEVLTLSFDLEKSANYDEDSSSWVLEAGSYTVRVGNSSRQTSPVCQLKLSETVVIEECQSKCAPEQKIDEVLAPRQVEEEIIVPSFSIDLSTFNHRVIAYHESDMVETSEVANIVNRLSTEEKAELLRGGDLSSNLSGIHNVMGAVGRTAITLRERKIGNILFSDGPAGISVMNHVRVQPDGTEKATTIPEKYNWGQAAALMEMKNVAKTGIDVYRYATAWPVEELLAQTWNLSLLTSIGTAVGDEMLEFGITLWLAPGMNIHRNPLCGRTFEYFSEDPFLTGKMSSAITKGVQSHKGIGTTIKHFCCNNQEDNRIGVSSNVNERALREIYLKGFRMAVEDSQPLAVMSSYNKLNGIYTANRSDLLNDILRNEWGFEGLVMTDWNSCGERQADPAGCAPAGNDIVMPGTEEDKQAILSAIEEGRISKEELRTCVGRIVQLIITSNIPFQE